MASVKAISKKEFNGFAPFRGPMVQLMATEKQWFTTKSKKYIGTVVFDHSDKDYNWVVLAEEDGQFRWIEGDSSIESEEECAEQLVAAMERIEKTGETVIH